MYKIKIINFIVFLAILCSCEFNSPTEGFKVEGSIANIQDYSDNSVMAFVCGDYPKIGTQISESKLNNNWFSMFLPYELKDKYCDAIANQKYVLFDTRFESNLIISNENVKIADVWFNSNKEYYCCGNILQFGYTEKFYPNGVMSSVLVKAKYVYAQSAVSITGEYETRLTQVYGVDLYKTVKFDLFLQKGWNIIYCIGTYVSPPNTVPDNYHLEETEKEGPWGGDVETATINITTIKPENIEFKWHYSIENSLEFIVFLRNNLLQFVYFWDMTPYYLDLICY